MKKIIPQNFFNYFKDCYQLDYSAFTLDNILSIKYKYKWFANEQEELLSGKLSYAPYFTKKIDDLKKEISLYALDKQLYYGAFFILGKNDNPKIKDKRLCAPLVLFPASLENEDNDTFIRINTQEIIINQQAIKGLQLKKNQESKDDFIKKCVDYFSVEQSNAFGLIQLLENTFSNIDTTDLSIYPKVWKESQIKKHFISEQQKITDFKIIPAAGSVLVNKTNASQKVLIDLKSIADQNEFNTSLNELLELKTSHNKFKTSFLKSKLNTNQYKALKNSYTYTNSVIIGPPGTGKSYTISNIVADAVLNEKSILVVSKTKAAVEVLRSIINKEFHLKNHLIHTSGFSYKKSLKAKVRRHLSGIVSHDNNSLSLNYIEALFSRLDKSEADFKEKITTELKINELHFKKDKSFKEHLHHFFLKHAYDLDETFWDYFFDIENYSHALNKNVLKFIQNEIKQNIQRNALSHRKDLSHYQDALLSSTFSEYKEEIAKVDYSNILKIFPIWLAHLSELNGVVPLQKELFDLVIIDEATQCDIASALPAIYRAKQVVIAGDPNQLKHYSFVSKNQQINLLDKYNLPNEKFFDYRNRSILDLFISKIAHQDQISFLREHFRSTPSLIQFSNEQFYDNQLEIIKSTPEYTTHSQVEYHYVNGNRDEKGINKIEADTIIEKIDSIIKKYKEIKNAPSLGIISLFSNQATHINTLIRKKYPLEIIKKHSILCGTPYQFQGNEREIILLSTVVCKNTHHSAFIHANKPEVLNVGITRAKSKQYVFTSITNKDIKQDSLLAQYLNFIQNFTYQKNKAQIQDNFQKEVSEVIENENIYKCISGYPVAGSVLDLLVIHNDKKYFIDLIGYPGEFTEAFSLERYKTLARTGIQCLPLHYSFWKKKPLKAKRFLLDFLDKKNNH